MNHTVEDLSLFNALRQGDGNSFDHLFRKYYPMLCAYAHRLVSLEDAEEIVQEVMLWLWENRGDLIIESSLNQYLFKMTYMADGIGDTVRVSLSEEPAAEIPVARHL